MDSSDYALLLLGPQLLQQQADRNLRVFQILALTDTSYCIGDHMAERILKYIKDCMSLPVVACQNSNL